MAKQKIVITRVGDPANPQEKANGQMDAGAVEMKDGRVRHWFTLAVEVRQGLRRATAERNFWAEDKDGLDREAALVAMRAQADVASDEYGLRVVDVEIEPRVVTGADGEPRVNERTGELILQRSATVIVLPGEALQAALTGTHRDAVLKGHAPAPPPGPEDREQMRERVQEMLARRSANGTPALG